MSILYGIRCHKCGSTKIGKKGKCLICGHKNKLTVIKKVCPRCRSNSITQKNMCRNCGYQLTLFDRIFRGRTTAAFNLFAFLFILVIFISTFASYHFIQKQKAWDKQYTLAVNPNETAEERSLRLFDEVDEYLSKTEFDSLISNLAEAGIINVQEISAINDAEVPLTTCLIERENHLGIQRLYLVSNDVYSNVIVCTYDDEPHCITYMGIGLFKEGKLLNRIEKLALEYKNIVTYRLQVRTLLLNNLVSSKDNPVFADPLYWNIYKTEDEIIISSFVDVPDETGTLVRHPFKVIAGLNEEIKYLDYDGKVYDNRKK